jgi:hypothetical protein
LSYVPALSGYLVSLFVFGSSLTYTTAKGVFLNLR